MPSPANDWPHPARSLQVLGDFVVLLVLTSELMVLFFRVLGIHDVVPLVALTAGWLSQAAGRLVAMRRGSREAGIPSALALAGCAPWCLLVIAHEASPAARIWQPIAMPSAVRFVGVAVVLAVVLARPLWSTARVDVAETGSVPKLQPDILVLIAGMWLVSPSPIILGVPFYWLALTVVPERLWRGAIRGTPGAPGAPVLLPIS